MTACLEYSTELFTGRTAAALTEDYLTVLRAVAEGSRDTPLTALLAPAGPPETEPVPAGASSGTAATVHEAIESWARATPRRSPSARARTG
ncbi:hypothetical protein NQP46_31825 [Streptomyces albus]|nr:hypothetical protein NQP46_31825 [Streptomyces albus]